MHMQKCRKHFLSILANFGINLFKINDNSERLVTKGKSIIILNDY